MQQHLRVRLQSVCHAFSRRICSSSPGVKSFEMLNMARISSGVRPVIMLATVRHVTFKSEAMSKKLAAYRKKRFGGVGVLHSDMSSSGKTISCVTKHYWCANWTKNREQCSRYEVCWNAPPMNAGSEIDGISSGGSLGICAAA